MIHRFAPPRQKTRSPERSRRRLRLEQLERREVLASMFSGTGDGHLQLLVNEQGAFGRHGGLEANSDILAGREVGDAVFNPRGSDYNAAGTTHLNSLAVRIDGGAVDFLTAGTVANLGGNTNGFFTSTADPRRLTSTFYYPNNATPATATLRFDLTQELGEIGQGGTAPAGVVLRQTYRVTNLTTTTLNVEIFRWFDGDLQYGGAASYLNDGAGMRIVQVGGAEKVWYNNTAINTPLNDLSFMEIRSDETTGVGPARPGRWEVGLSRGALGTAPNGLPAKDEPYTTNSALMTRFLTAGYQLADDIVPANFDNDGNQAADIGRGSDWATILRNVYVMSAGNTTAYVAETQWGNPPVGDVPPPSTPVGNVSGFKFSDRDSNGIQDPADNGVGGFRIFADINNDTIFNPSEPSAVTGTNGFYSLTLAARTEPYIIREVQQLNWTPTAPAAGFYSITVSANSATTGINFGNHAAPATISGSVFEDINRNGQFDAGELNLAGATIFLDFNNNGAVDIGEPITTSAAITGAWSIANLDPGSYVVRQAPPGGYEQTAPGGGGPIIVTVQPGQTLGGVTFGDAPLPGQVSGKIYFDTNGNGIIDPGEPGAAGVYVYIDYDNNCRIGIGENAIVTDARGTFGLMRVPVGTYSVKIIPANGQEQVFPIGGPCAGVQVTVGAGGLAVADFLVKSTNNGGLDYGDAPATFPVTLAQDGARHQQLAGFQLGALLDGEPDGQPSALANGDDSVSADEDGVQFLDPLIPGQSANIRVIVNTGTQSTASGTQPRPSGRLQAWFDWNDDGDWSDAGEKVISDSILPTGVYILPISVPAGAQFGNTFARFRYGYEPGLGVSGASVAGEVEDYLVTIVGPNPIANDDTYSLNSFDTITLDVLANDVQSSSGPITIVSSTLPNNVTVVNDGTGEKLEYVPSATQTFQQFTYTVIDPAGNTDTALVTIFLPPLPQDDVFIDVPAGVQEYPLNGILSNDFPLGGLTIIGVTTPSLGGTATVSADGLTIIYSTPTLLFAGTETFFYTVQDANGLMNSAQITVQTTNSAADDLVELGLNLLTYSGTPLVDTTIGPGQLFKVQVTVDDLRLISPDPPESRGVFAAYLDLLLDQSRLEVVSDQFLDLYNPALGFNIQFGSSYAQVQLGDDDIPGVIDDVGAQQAGDTPLGADAITLFTVVLRAKAAAPAGQAQIATDTGDDPPITDVLLFQPDNPFPSPNDFIVPVERLKLNQAFVTIDPSEVPDNSLAPPGGEPAIISSSSNTGGNGGGSSGGSVTAHTNTRNRYDVNGDTFVSALDALLILNSLNAIGPRSLAGVSPTPGFLFDVSGDNFVTPLDALMVITRLNSGPTAGEAEGEAASASAAAESTAVATGSSGASQLPNEAPATTARSAAPEATTPASSAPATPASLPLVAPTSSASGVDFGSSLGSDDDADDDFDTLLSNLANDTCPHWN